MKKLTPIELMIVNMARYPEYEAILDTPGLAYEFNEFVKAVLSLEKLVLDHWQYKDKQAMRRAERRKAKVKA